MSKCRLDLERDIHKAHMGVMVGGPQTFGHVVSVRRKKQSKKYWKNSTLLVRMCPCCIFHPISPGNLLKTGELIWACSLYSERRKVSHRLFTRFQMGGKKGCMQILCVLRVSLQSFKVLVAISPTISCVLFLSPVWLLVIDGLWHENCHFTDFFVFLLFNFWRFFPSLSSPPKRQRLEKTIFLIVFGFSLNTENGKLMLDKGLLKMNVSPLKECLNSFCRAGAVNFYFQRE